jgi:uncharacterized protein YbjT (DUF2867 family)
MPVIVVGADTSLGSSIVSALLAPGREVRAFVTDESAATKLKSLGVKVALGDVSDESHIEGAATRCFSAVLVVDAATDSRERAFAKSRDDVLKGWANAVARVTRVIWVTDAPVPEVKATQVAVIDPEDPDVVQKVVRMDDAAEI